MQLTTEQRAYIDKSKQYIDYCMKQPVLDKEYLQQENKDSIDVLSRCVASLAAVENTLQMFDDNADFTTDEMKELMRKMDCLGDYSLTTTSRVFVKMGLSVLLTKYTLERTAKESN